MLVQCHHFVPFCFVWSSERKYWDERFARKKNIFRRNQLMEVGADLIGGNFLTLDKERN